MTYAYDPELLPFIDLLPHNVLDSVEVLHASRGGLEQLLAPMNAAVDLTGIAVTDRTIPGPAGAPEVAIRVYAPEAAAPEGGRPALLDIHGGGFVSGSIEMEHAFAARVASELAVVVVTPEYRLAPEDPFPAGLEDCYAALSWIHATAGELGVDTSRVAIGGQSAGGGLSAGLALLARDRGGPAICFQLLGIPELDHRLETASMRAFTDTPLWHRPNAIKSWEWYLGEHEEVSPYASPSIAPDLSGLPPAYISTMEFDPLRDEGIHYALRLLEAGVQVELHSFPGTFHGSALATTAAVSRRGAEELLVALRRGLQVG